MIRRNENGQVQMIPVQHIVPNPNQPRRQWKEEELESLSQSIRTSGVLQPITVRRLKMANMS